MKRVVVVASAAILSISILSNLLGIYILDKCLHSRDYIRFIEGQSGNSTGLSIYKETQFRQFKGDISVFIGGSLVRLWMFSSDLPLPLVNKGILEDPSSGTLARFNKDVIALKPKMVLIKVGVCDIHTNVSKGNSIGPVVEQVFSSIEKMVGAARDAGIQPILTTLRPVRPKFLFAHLPLLEYSSKGESEENSGIALLNEKIKILSKKKSLLLIDFYDALKDSKGQLSQEFSLPDGEHLHHLGYVHLNKLLKQQLGKNLSAL
jgi:lysophospholipase L1-like esterase